MEEFFKEKGGHFNAMATDMINFLAGIRRELNVAESVFSENTRLKTRIEELEKMLDIKK